jgi:pimeloyl-ACP methyl ester carboxylesterase
VANATKGADAAQPTNISLSPQTLYSCEQRVSTIQNEGVAGTIKAIVDMDIASVDSAKSLNSRDRAKTKLINSLSTSDIGFSRANKAVAAWDNRDRDLEDLGLRTLMLTVAEDLVGGPAGTVQMANMVANAQVKVLTGAGHHPMWENIRTPEHW